MRIEPGMLRAVAALVAGAVGERDGAIVQVMQDGGRLSVGVAACDRLVSDGVLLRDGNRYRAGPLAGNWLRRQKLRRATSQLDPQAGQHRRTATDAEGVTRNLDESPLARLATAGAVGEPAWLEPHQVAAGERYRRLAERARLRQRVTMSYSATHTANGGGGRAADPSDMALDARRELARIDATLPRDCAGVLMDVCGLEKGLQLVESERGWPRRSAKLVLRIALEALAGHWGLTEVAEGAETRHPHRWMAGERPAMFSE